MKKIGVLFLILFLIPTALAIETTLKQNYQPRETLIAEISGNFIDNLKAEDILFYSGRLYTPMIYDLSKIQDKYYLYALLPNKQRNYTLIIKNAHYFEQGQEKQEDIKLDFKVSGNTSLFTINPGFIITNKDFGIKVESNVKTISLSSNFLDSSQEVQIPEGETKTIRFSVSDIKEFTVTSLTLNSDDTEYKFPVAIFPTETSKVTTSENLRFSKTYLNFTVLENKDFEFPVTLINTGQGNIENITLYSDLDIIKIKPEKITVLEAGNSTEIIITINSAKQGILEGTISANSGNYSSEISLSITTTKSEEEFKEFINNSEILEEKSCKDLNGKFCKDDEECDGTTKLTIGGLCCIGKCKKETTRYGKTIALIIIVIVLIIIVFFVFKKLKAKPKSSKELLKEKSEEYESRFKSESKEIRGGLSKV